MTTQDEAYGMLEAQRVAAARDLHRLLDLIQPPLVTQAVRMDLRTDDGDYTIAKLYSEDAWAEIQAIVARYPRPA